MVSRSCQLGRGYLCETGSIDSEVFFGREGVKRIMAWQECMAGRRVDSG
jgi:hypothetical protein